MLFRLFALVAILLVSACATFEGVGEDISTSGDAVSDAARDVEEEVN